MRIVTEEELRDKIRKPEFGVKLIFPAGTRFSPSARDFIKQWEVEVHFEEPSPEEPETEQEEQQEPA